MNVIFVRFSLLYPAEEGSAITLVGTWHTARVNPPQSISCGDISHHIHLLLPWNNLIFLGKGIWSSSRREDCIPNVTATWLHSSKWRIFVSGGGLLHAHSRLYGFMCLCTWTLNPEQTLWEHFAVLRSRCASSHILTTILGEIFCLSCVSFSFSLLRNVGFPLEKGNLVRWSL